MKNNAKPIIALTTGAILFLGAQSQTAQAQGVLNPLTPGGPSDTGTSILADAFGVATAPEAITVSWSVSENLSGIYTYSYVVNNPLGDVLLNPNGSPTTTPEIVDAFAVSFNTTVLNAFVVGSQTGGVADQNNGAAGLFWSFAAVNPNSSGPVLSFQSHLAPVYGNANAQDANPPSPWASNPNGQQVPVPSAVPEPSTMILFALAGLLVLPFRDTLLKLASQK